MRGLASKVPLARGPRPASRRMGATIFSAGKAAAARLECPWPELAGSWRTEAGGWRDPGCGLAWVGNTAGQAGRG